MTDLTRSAAIEIALQALHPSRFGFVRRANVPINQNADIAWQKTILGVGDVYFTRLDWQHANQYFDWNGTMLAGLEIINALQHHIWALTPNNLTAPLDMASIVDTGGYVGVAYRADAGLSPDGWLGFVLGFGARNGVLASRFLAVHPSGRNMGIARDLKLLQGYAALQTGHHAAEWTFDPMRSLNAYLNFNKLGAYTDRYKVNKYGKLKSALYGDVPSDRFVVHWDLLDSTVHAHLQGTSHLVSIDPDAVPTVAPANLNIAIEERWPLVKLSVPYDIARLMASDPSTAAQARAGLRAVCIGLLDADIPIIQDSPRPDPAFAGVEYQTGRYRLSQVVTDPEQRNNFYIFHLKDID